MSRSKTFFDSYRRRIPPHIRPFTNKYFITVIFFVLWMLFFDKSNIVAQYKLSDTLDNLKMQKIYYLEKTENVKADYVEVFTNDTTLEKFARERYFMKKSNEEVFVIFEEEE